jgi:hypothetical protein
MVWERIPGMVVRMGRGYGESYVGRIPGMVVRMGRGSTVYG